MTCQSRITVFHIVHFVVASLELEEELEQEDWDKEEVIEDW